MQFEFSKSTDAIEIVVSTPDAVNVWLDAQSASWRHWYQDQGLSGNNGDYCLFADDNGHLAKVLFIHDEPTKPWVFADCAKQLPPRNYYFSGLSVDALERASVDWGLGAYAFTHYKSNDKSYAHLSLDKQLDEHRIVSTVATLHWVKDLINTPAEDLNPDTFNEQVRHFAKTHSVQCKEIIGDKLLKHNFPLIYAVGRASEYAPRLIELRHGDPKHFALTLVGKGVCFDTGGLDLKNSAGMLLMRKDMGGAAFVLGLVRWIIEQELPIYLRVLIPTVENAIDGKAFRPSDIFTARNGKTVEIGNTDAEGRLILADALTYAGEENVDCVLDIATLTGAARVALGPDIVPFYSDDQALTETLISASEQTGDLLWRMPLYAPYKKMLDSVFADINNCGSGGMAGSVTAALFLQQFIKPSIPWAHFDIYGWNQQAKPGRTQGGDVTGLRALMQTVERIGAQA